MIDRASVLDASSVLALALNEAGAEVAGRHLARSAISTVNWSEILRRAEQEDVSVEDLRATLTEGGVSLLAFTEDDATAAAALWRATHQHGLSLDDRACLALAARLDVPAVTADRAWRDLDVGVEIVCIR